MRVEIYGCQDTQSCVIPLGIESGHLPDSALSASSSAGAQYYPQFSRLNININEKGNLGSWCANFNDGNQWLQVDFGRETTVTKVATQGRNSMGEWVRSYSLSYSTDGTHWAQYRLTDGHVKVLGGNIDVETPVYHHLHPPIHAKYLRFHPKTWNSHICMRVEAYGCQKYHHCVMSLGVEDGRIQDSAMSVSTIDSSGHEGNLARLNLVAASSKQGAWCSQKLDEKQWLKIDLGVLTTVTKVATQGRGHEGYSQWVTSYFISYSINNSYWANYTVDGDKKVFRGNFDRHSIVVSDIFPPIRARFIRIHPVTWHNYLCMRVELFGCPIRGI
ncbi:hypothetical protein ABFA07_020861 [Porites harrisoni]